MSLSKARTELTRVQREVSRLQELLNNAQALETKIMHYIEMVERFESGSGDPAGDKVAHTHSVGATDKPKPASSGVSYDAVRATIRILREEGKPIRTVDLLPKLKMQGIEIGGNNPVANLSGFLSRSPELTANRSLGWHLSEWLELSDREKSINELA